MIYLGSVILFFWLNGEPVDLFTEPELIEIHRYEQPKMEIIEFGKDVYIEYDISNNLYR